MTGSVLKMIVCIKISSPNIVEMRLNLQIRLVTV